MLSKNNKQLITRMNAKQKQRFGLRKLSIGVASVLLGTTFLIGATAQADTVNDAGSGTEHETALVNNNTTNKLDNQSNQLTLSPVEEA
ncbi:MAG: YSIRK-type signal peptide-containing protein, partial [Candidatus Limosilactobacillus intestinavium]